jgi:hypothetical protein
MSAGASTQGLQALVTRCEDKAATASGNWSLSPSASDAVVSDTPTGHDNPGTVEYYGGHLVAESIPTTLRPLVTAAPKLLAALKGLLAIASESRGVAGYHLNGDVADWGDFPEWHAACAAVAEAEARS